MHLQTRLITASQCISNLAPLRSPSLHNHSLQVHLQTRSITASKYILKVQQLVYRDRVVTEVDRVTGKIYLADPGVYGQHLISISSYHPMKIHTLFIPTFGLTRSFQDFLDPCKYVDPQCRVVSYILIRFLRTSIQNCSIS